MLRIARCSVLHACSSLLLAAAREAREHFGWTKKRKVEVYQDNVRLHYAPAALAKAEEARVVFFGEAGGLRPPTESPCLNMIENLFGQGRAWLLEREAERPAKSVHVTNARFERFCSDIAPKRLKALAASMPKRLADCIAAKGGAIDY